MISIDEYCIVSISEARLAYKMEIERKIGRIPKTGHIDFVDGKTANIGKLQYEYNIDNIWNNAKLGELGVWFSMLNICKYSVKNNKTVLALEDDAIITSENFDRDLKSLADEVPSDADAFSVFSPRNQHDAVHYEWLSRNTGITVKHSGIAPPYIVPGAEKVVRAYQGYSFVAMVYTPTGSKNILDRVQSTGFNMPADCWLFEEEFYKRLNVYTPLPQHATLVDIDWDSQAATQVHNTKELRHVLDINSPVR